MSKHLSTALAAMRGRNGSRPDHFDEFLASTAPTLHALLTSSIDDEGKKRRTSTLTVFVDEQDGRLKASLTDRDHEMTLWATISSTEHLWDEIEGQLTSPNPNWRKKKGTLQNYSLRK